MVLNFSGMISYFSDHYVLAEANGKLIDKKTG